jgi:hypothetical protein
LIFVGFFGTRVSGPPQYMLSVLFQNATWAVRFQNNLMFLLPAHETRPLDRSSASIRLRPARSLALICCCLIATRPRSPLLNVPTSHLLQIGRAPAPIAGPPCTLESPLLDLSRQAWISAARSLCTAETKRRHLPPQSPCRPLLPHQPSMPRTLHLLLTSLPQHLLL